MHGGGQILLYYNNSSSRALVTVYPEHDWMVWRFHRMPDGYWDTVMKEKLEQQRIVDWLNVKLSIQSLDEWYRVSMAEIQNWVMLRSDPKILIQMLQTAYPTHQWDTNRLGRTGGPIKASQRQLRIAVQQLFPTHRICSKGNISELCRNTRGLQASKAT